MVLETALRVGIVVVLAVVLAFVWYFDGRGRWWELLTDRFVLGVPWGSVVSILLVLLVYLFVQSGIENWQDPAVLPFRSWSYSYVLGMLAAGFTHAGPGHFLGNTLATLVLAPLVEYAWGHYPLSARRTDQPDTGYDHPPPAAPSEADRAAATGKHNTDGDPSNTDGGADGASAGAGESGDSAGLFARPLARAFVIFPLALVALSVVTSVLARGWSLGYSGTVFFLLGVAVVLVPLATVVGMVALTGVNVLFSALQTPILQVTTGTGPPGPPSWAGINVQAHLVGFLLGVLVAFALLRRRDRWPDVGRLALAVVLVVLSRGLWSYATSSGSTYTRWQGIGVIFVLFLAAVIVAMVAVDDRRLFGSVTLRGVVVGGIVAITLLIALSSVPPNIVGMDDDPVPDTGTITVQDYTVTYAEDVPHGRVDFNSSGVIVVSEQRDIWSRVVQPSQLAHSGEATATVGGVGWREVVTVERSGWQVLGNDTVYAVALEHDDRRVEAFQSDPKRADAHIAGHAVTVVAGPGEFRLRITHDNETVGETVVPDTNETLTVDLVSSAAVEELTVTTTDRDGDRRIVVEHGNTRVPVAEAEN
ncbi:MAG: membrane associated rhomboid family serine protease [Halovenus sp.]|jgi:membrane associated rhomboid family serine protease